MKKRIVFLLLLVAMLATLLAGCIGYFTCDLCGEKKLGIKHQEKIWGQTVTYCDSCKDALESLT